MIRTLLITAASSLVLTVLCFGGVVAIAGNDLAKSGKTIEQYFEERFGDGLNGEDWQGAETTRELPWDGSEELVIGHRGHVRYVQGEPAKIVVTGPAKGVDQLIVTNGRLRMPGERNGELGIPLSGAVRLDVELTAPSVKKFRLWGSSTLSIENYDQPELDVEILGSGDVIAQGKADKIKIDIRGSGSADTAAMESDITKVDIKGSGDVRIAPLKIADIDIAGSGDVDLMSDPEELRTNIKGSGDINQIGRSTKPNVE